MSQAARLLIAAAELLEAEGHALRRGVFVTVFAVLLAMISAAVLLLAVTLLIVAVFLQLQILLGTPGAAAVAGVARCSSAWASSPSRSASRAPAPAPRSTATPARRTTREPQPNDSPSAPHQARP